MADTYGYDANGKQQYDPNMYDQWGVYMGNRAPLVKQSNVSTPSGFGHSSAATMSFEDWLPQYAKGQLARGRGSLPEVTAAQGTPEYRDQVAKAQEAAQWIIDRGGTVGDMGIRPAKGAGLNLWNQYSSYKGGQLSDAFKAMAKRYYDKDVAAGNPDTTGMGDGMATPATDAGSGQVGFYGTYSDPKSGGWGAFYNNPASSSMGAPSASPAPLATPTVNPTATQNAAITGWGGANTGYQGNTAGKGQVYQRKKRTQIGRGARPVPVQQTVSTVGMGSGIAPVPQ